MLRFQHDIQEIADRATAKHRSVPSDDAPAASTSHHGASTSAAEPPITASSSSTHPHQQPSSTKPSLHKKKPSLSGGPSDIKHQQHSGSSTRSPVAQTTAALPSPPIDVDAQSPPPSTLQALLLVNPYTSNSQAALVAALELALRRSGANEVLLRVGRRRALNGWYEGGKVGVAGGEGEGEWEGERLEEAEVELVKERLKGAMDELGGSLVPLHSSASPPSYSALLRLPPPSLEHLPELRIAVVGNVDAGKSTTLGVLTRGGLDDGRGRARVGLFRHKHEVESGRTSSVGMEVLGFTVEGEPVLGGGGKAEGAAGGEVRREKLGWEEICRRSAKIVSFLDLAGHERYLKTTIFGMTGCAPDYCLLMVASNAGMCGMAKEHLAVALALNVPVVVCITKIDMTPAHVLAQTKTQLAKLLRSPGCRRTPVFVEDQADVVELSQSFVRDRLCPIFLLSNVTGESVPLLRSFLNLLPTSTQTLAQGTAAGRYTVDAPLEYSVSDVYAVPFVGVVVNGVINSGTVRQGDNVLLGPDSLGHFVSTSIKSIQRKRAGVASAEAGQSVTFALKRVRRTAVRKGMVIVAKSETGEVPHATRRFEGQVLVLYHNTTIQPGYQAVMHTGAVRQTCRIISMDHPKGVLRTGDRCTVTFEFVSAPEFVKEGDKLLFREGKTKGLGVVTKILG